MKYLIIISIIGILLDISDAELSFNEFKLKYNKTYESNIENRNREINFHRNLKKIQEHNKKCEHGLVSYKMGINMFADLAENEIENMIMSTQFIKSDILESTFRKSTFLIDIPDAIDWREKGAVTPVKNQGELGDSMRFGAIGSLEGQYFLKNGILITLNEKDLNCSVFDSVFGNESCAYISDNLTFVIENFERIQNATEEVLQSSIATIGPIGVIIDATNLVFYVEGVFYDPECSSTIQNHVTLAVGYGTTDEDEQYYILKNSWGTNWGENGYVRIARNRNNHCGVVNFPFYPII